MTTHSINRILVNVIVTDDQKNKDRHDRIFAKAQEIMTQFWEQMVLDLEAEGSDVVAAVEGVVLPAYLTAATSLKMQIENLVRDVGGHTWEEPLETAAPTEGN